MAAHKVGTSVRVKAAVDAVGTDDVGRVVSFHPGQEGQNFYGVRTNDGRTAYFPEGLIDAEEGDNLDLYGPDTDTDAHLNIGSGAATSGLGPNWNGSSSQNLPAASAVVEKLSPEALVRIRGFLRNR
jgi:hypothetical protein